MELRRLLCWTAVFNCFYILKIGACLLPKFKLEILPHTDVIIISDLKLTAANLAACQKRHNMAHVATLDSLHSKLIGPQVDVTWIVAMSEVTGTLRAIELIGNLSHDESAVVLWPQPVQDDNAAASVMTSLEFQNLIQPFEMGSRLVFIFENGVNLQSVYHFYALNTIIVFKKINEKGQQEVMTCGICTTPTHQLNAFRTILQVQDAREQLNATAEETFETPKPIQLHISSFFMAVEQHWNFTVRYVRSLVKEAQRSDGSWTGIVSEVAEGRSHVGINVRAMLKSKATQIAYLPPLGDDRISAFFIQPESHHIRDIFVGPFQWPMWTVTVFTLLFMATSMVLVSIVRQKFCVTASRSKVIDPRSSDDDEPDHTGDSFIMILATAVQQGWQEHPVAVSLRTILICASFMNVILYAGYSAAIVSSLSTTSDTITTPEALLNSGLSFGVRVDYSRKDWIFKASDTDYYAAIINRLSTTEGEGYVTGTKALQLMLSKPYAYVSSHVRMYESFKGKLSAEDICKITELPVLTSRLQFGMFTAKTYPLKEFLRRIFILLRERGILWRLRNQFLDVRRCMTNVESTGHALDTNDVFTAVMLLVVTHILSLTFLFLEKAIYRRSNIFIN